MIASSGHFDDLDGAFRRRGAGILRDFSHFSEPKPPKPCASIELWRKWRTMAHRFEGGEAKRVNPNFFNYMLQRFRFKNSSASPTEGPEASPMTGQRQLKRPDRHPRFGTLGTRVLKSTVRDRKNIKKVLTRVGARGKLALLRRECQKSFSGSRLAKNQESAGNRFPWFVKPVLCHSSFVLRGWVDGRTRNCGSAKQTFQYNPVPPRSWSRDRVHVLLFRRRQNLVAGRGGLGCSHD
jgi:hypothetical protein